MPKDEARTRVSVWDPVVRYGHWALVAAFALAYLSAEEDVALPDPLHVWGGYAVGTVVLLRVIWGFVGSPHARFTDFAYGPFAALRYLTALLAGRAHRYVGHSPAGAMMVFALLICLAGTVGTGIAAYGQQGHGPLAAPSTAVPPASGETRIRAEGSQDEADEDSAIGEVHGVLANMTLALILFHVLGVLLASVQHRENLAAAMISGKKRAGD